MNMHSSSQRSSDDHVFNRPLHLSGILDNAADDLAQTWLGYEWNDRTRCNCCVVARQVMQTTAPKLKQLLPPIYENGAFYATWSAMTERYCTETGLTENEVFRQLLHAGLKVSDFAHLEDLSHPEIVKHMDPYRLVKSPVVRSRKSDVIAYLRAWAIGIEKFHDPAPVTARETSRS